MRLALELLFRPARAVHAAVEGYKQKFRFGQVFVCVCEHLYMCTCMYPCKRKRICIRKCCSDDTCTQPLPHGHKVVAIEQKAL